MHPPRKYSNDFHASSGGADCSKLKNLDYRRRCWMLSVWEGESDWRSGENKKKASAQRLTNDELARATGTNKLQRANYGNVWGVSAGAWLLGASLAGVQE